MTALPWKRLAFLVLALFLALVPSARAAEPEPVAAPPRDVPLILRPEVLKLPPVPATYQQKDLGWIKFAYVASAHERVAPLIRDAEEIKARLTDELGQPVLDKVEVRVGRTPEEMATLAPAEAPPPPYGSGVAYDALHLVLLTLSAPGSNVAVDLDEVFRHELAHIALSDAVLHRHVPRWFNEGLAIYESNENPTDRIKTLWDATLSGTILPLADIDRSFPTENYEVSIAYAESADFVRFLMRKNDRERFERMIDRVRDGQSFDRAVADAYGSDLRKLEFQWKEELSKRYTIIPVITGGSLVWVLVIGALVVGYIKKRRRSKATLARWAEEEARADAAIAAAEQAETRASLVEVAVQARTSELPKVEHDGSWHTLH
jgi:Peptidase MA superfamily